MGDNRTYSEQMLGHGLNDENHVDQGIFTADAPAGDTSASNRPAPRARQPWARLLKAVLDLAGEEAELLGHLEREWASATFSGSRHAITLRFSGLNAAEAGEAFIVALPDHEFSIPRYLVADAMIVRVDDRKLPEPKLVVEIELLLLEPA